MIRLFALFIPIGLVLILAGTARADASFAMAEIVEHRTVLSGQGRALRLKYRIGSCNWFEAKVVSFERNGTLVLGVVAVANNLVDCAESRTERFGEVSWELSNEAPSRLSFISR